MRMVPMIAAALLLNSLPSWAEEVDRISMVGTTIPDLFEEGKGFYYNRIYDQLVAGYDGHINLTMTPIKRASLSFSAGEADCLFIGIARPDRYMKLELNADDLIFSDTINVTRVKAYTAKGTVPIETADDLIDGFITVDSGIGDVELLTSVMPNVGTKFLVSPSLRHGFRLLDIGRTRVLVAIELDVKVLQLEDAAYKDYSVSETFNIDQAEDVFVCKKSHQTGRFLQHINRRIAALDKSGFLNIN